MMRTTRCLLALAINVVATIASYAQGGVRQLAPEPVNVHLNGSNAIQAAASIGRSTLVAWGTLRAAGDTVLSTLVTQIIRDGKSIGTPVIAHGDSARPSRSVWCVALGERFLLFWNDVRPGNAGLYLRTFDTNGVATSLELRLHDRAPHDSGLVFAYNSRGGVTVFFMITDGSTAGTYVLGLDRDGGVEKPLDWIGKRPLTTIQRFSSLDGLALVMLDSADARLLYPDGRMDTRTVPWQRLANASHVASDTSLVEFSDSLVRYYYNIFDSMPYRSVSVSIDTAIAGTASVTRDSAGNVVLRYQGTYQTSNQGRWDRWYEVVIGDSASSPRVIDTLRRDPSLCRTCSWIADRLTSVQRFRLCDNATLVQVNWWATYLGGPVESGPFSVIYRVDKTGAFRRTADTVGISCTQHTGAVPVDRIRTDTFSIVRLAGGGPALSVPIAPTLATTGQYQPGLYFNAGRRSLAWMEGWSVASGPRLLSLDVPAEVVEDSVARIVFDEIPSRGFNVVSTAFGRGYSLHQSSGHPVVISRAMRDDYVKYYQNTPGYQHEYGIRLDFAVVRNGRWQTCSGLSRSSSYYMPSIEIESISVDPASGTVFMSVRSGLSQEFAPPSFSERAIYWITPDGVLRSRAGNVHLDAPWLRVIAVDSTDCLVHFGHTVTRSGVPGEVPAFTIDSLHSHERYLPWTSAKFVRLHRSVVDTTELRIELWSTSGGIERRSAIHAGTHARDVIFVPDTSGRRAILLWPIDSSGLHAAFVDGELNLLVADTLLHATTFEVSGPTALFDGDSTFVAWVENRNGDHDIYGLSTLAPSPLMDTTSAVRSMPAVPIMEQRAVIGSIVPNPSTHSTLIEVHLPFDIGAEIVIHDLLGREVTRRQIVGSRGDRVSVAIDTRAFVAGRYIVVLRSGGSVDVRRLDVHH